jgi:protein-L-isoaspartate(D-aspartate) O-methyltransferase
MVGNDGSRVAGFVDMRLLQLTLALLLLVGCKRASPPPPSGPGASSEDDSRQSGATLTSAYVAGDSSEARAARTALVRHLQSSSEITDRRVLAAMRDVPRHLFVPDVPIDRAYEDRPVSIGHGQTISQPTVVALMTQALELRGSEKVLEIGTGSGYQAAILARIASGVYSIEIVPQLAEQAQTRLEQLGYTNVHVRVGDGYAGWPARGPYDRIILTAAPKEVPQVLLDQLADGGILVAPLGAGEGQRLVRMRKSGGQMQVEDLGGVSFVPMVVPKVR